MMVAAAVSIGVEHNGLMFRFLHVDFLMDVEVKGSFVYRVLFIPFIDGKGTIGESTERQGVL